MAQLTIPQTFDLAIQHHQAGRLSEAEQLYRQLLARQPAHADALHMLGVIAYQTGRHELAVALIRKAIAVHPNWPEAYYNLGNTLKELGQLEEAITAFQRAIALKPNWAEVHNNLGNALQAAGRAAEAIAACRQAIALQANYPQAYNNLGNALRDHGKVDQAIGAFHQALALAPAFPEAHNNLGAALKDQGSFAQAVAAFRQAIALNPRYAEAYSNLGVALKEQGQLDQAIDAYRQALTINPNYPEALSNLGMALKEQGQLDQAIDAYRHALAINPNYPEALSNLGIALIDKGLLEEAITSCRQATILKPAYAEAHNNLGLVLSVQGRLDQAVAAYRRAIALKPDLADGHWNLALALLARGDFAEGWEEYEWRWDCTEARGSRRKFRQAEWDGGPLHGRTILLHAEQGLGDTIQFIRYLPLVVRRGGRVRVECQPLLERLLQAMAGDITVVARGQPLPEFDVHCPLMSLPRVLATTLPTIPGQVPYLHASAQSAKWWRNRLANHGPAIKVGLIWAGNPQHKNDRNRSIKLATLAPLAQVSSVDFYSLQKGAAAAQSPPPGMNLSDPSDDLKDFIDTAGLIANLDLVIAVDTAVAHLAGAMGKPVWTLLPYAPDWRWLRDRTDSPWYPTMRLFRQSAIGDWAGVIQQVTAALASLVQRG